MGLQADDIVHLDVPIWAGGTQVPSSCRLALCRVLHLEIDAVAARNPSASMNWAFPLEKQAKFFGFRVSN